MMFNKLIDIVA